MECRLLRTVFDRVPFVLPPHVDDADGRLSFSAALVNFVIELNVIIFNYVTWLPPSPVIDYLHVPRREVVVPSSNHMQAAQFR
jgi:hypothetical protein